MVDLEFIKIQRKANRYSCRHIAEMLGFNSASTYWKMETGQTSLKCRELEQISIFYEQPIERFFTTDQPK